MTSAENQIFLNKIQNVKKKLINGNNGICKLQKNVKFRYDDKSQLKT